VLARVHWEIAKVEPGCEIAVAVWHPSKWYNYAWAGDGELMNATPNWWGVAQEAHPEIKDNPVAPNQTRLLDVLSTAEPVETGDALLAWYVQDGITKPDLDNVQAYLTYGCGNSRKFKVSRAETELISGAALSPTPSGR
jgi:hypothetical protein